MRESAKFEHVKAKFYCSLASRQWGIQGEPPSQLRSLKKKTITTVKKQKDVTHTPSKIFLVGFPLEKPTIEFAQRSAV